MLVIFVVGGAWIYSVCWRFVAETDMCIFHTDYSVTVMPVGMSRVLLAPCRRLFLLCPPPGHTQFYFSLWLYSKVFYFPLFWLNPVHCLLYRPVLSTPFQKTQSSLLLLVYVSHGYNDTPHPQYFTSLFLVSIFILVIFRLNASLPMAFLFYFYLIPISSVSTLNKCLEFTTCILHSLARLSFCYCY